VCCYKHFSEIVMTSSSCRRMLLAAALVSCTGPIVESGGFQVSQEYLNADLAQIRPRAVFAFGCPADKIEFVVLGVDAGHDMAGLPLTARPGQIGASGCGHRGIFVEGHEGWALTSAATDSPPPPSPTAH
jgi:hypothetical protein